MFMKISVGRSCLREHLKEIRDLAKLNWGKSIPGKGTSQRKSPEGDVCLAYLKSGKETSMAKAD